MTENTAIGKTHHELLPYLTRFENLVKIVESPPGAETNLDTVRALHKEVVDLQEEEKLFYNGLKAYVDFLISLKARPDQTINRKILVLDFWPNVAEMLGDHMIKEGDSYSQLYLLRDVISKSIVDFCVEHRDQIKKVNLGLTELEYDLRLVKDGNLDSGLNFTYAHSLWSTLNKSEPEVSLANKTLRWGDVGSSSDDELVKTAVGSLTKTKTKSTPGVTLPEDFDSAFPMLWRRIGQFCRAHEWDLSKEKGTRLRDQGLVLFRENEDGTINSEKLEDDQRLALASLYTSIAALFIKPQSLVDENATEVALTFACSLIAKEQLAKDNSELLKIALKNGDGGEATFNGRLYSLCKTGSSAIKLVMVAIKKLLSKFAREIPKDSLDEETVKEITGRAFTSVEGMLSNSCRTTLKDDVRTVNKMDRRGKITKVQEKIRKLHVIVPDLTSARAPLKPSESAKVNDLRSKFNNRKAEVEKRIGKVTNPDLFSRPKVCQEVVQEAYTKLLGYKTILRRRMVIIRGKATDLNSGKKPGPDHWAQATAEVLKECPDIPEAIWDGLCWS